MQDMVMNIMFIALVAVTGFIFFRFIIKKRKLLNYAREQEEVLTESLKEDLPDGYVVLTDVKFITKVGRSRADFVILCPYGIFSLEYRQFYIYIRADEEASRWTYAESFRGKPFTSPLYQSKIHLDCIKELIGDKPDLKTYPMCAFPNNAEIELKNPSDDAFVGLVPGVIPWIEQWNEEVCLTEEEIQAIAELLKLNSEKVENEPAPEPVKETPEEYKAFIPGDFRAPVEDEDEDEDDEDYDDEESEDEESEDEEIIEDETEGDEELAEEEAEEKAEEEIEEEKN